MKITVLTPSVRADSLDIVKKSLERQTFPRENWEWLVGSPFEYKNCDCWVKDPGKNENDFYSLNKTYNALIRQAKGELIISYQDGIWTNSDILEQFWNLYQLDKKSCVGAIGDQYLSVDEFGKPIICVWKDPRRTDKYGEYYEIFPVDMEFTLCSIPKQALLDCFGFKEEWDKFCALSEKELCARIDKFGYRFFLDNGCEYRALKHGRLGGEEAWNRGYEEGCKYYDYCLKEISEGKDLKGDL